MTRRFLSREVTTIVVRKWLTSGFDQVCRPHESRLTEYRRYGFTNVVTPGDILNAHPEIWPFSNVFADYYKKFARPLPRSIDSSDPSKSLKIDAVFVYNDPRDWGLDATVILDLLLSSQGVLGTLSDKNGREDLPNRGYQQDGQPPLYFSNPDLWWAAKYHLPRLGPVSYTHLTLPTKRIV